VTGGINETIPVLFSRVFKQSEFFDSAFFRKKEKSDRRVTATLPHFPPAVDELPTPTPPLLAFHDERHGLSLYHGNCLDLLGRFAANCSDGLFDMVFADPPYFLSNGGSTCQNGERVAVTKGAWDESRGLICDLKFTLAWLRECKRVLKPRPYGLTKVERGCLISERGLSASADRSAI
ncbi:MAG: hypothetical protein ABIV39_18870, partial [Verrucomicrobiota bacterium]